MRSPCVSITSTRSKPPSGKFLFSRGGEFRVPCILKLVHISGSVGGRPRVRYRAVGMFIAIRAACDLAQEVGEMTVAPAIVKG